MKQIKINCPKCRRFVKPVADKAISENKLRLIAECKKCNIKVLHQLSGTIYKLKGKNVYDGKIVTTINEQIDENTFNKYKKQFQEKKKSAKQLVLDYLAKNRKAVTKHALSEKLNLKESTINRVIRVLKKGKLISYGFIAQYEYGFGARKKYAMLK